MSPYSICCAGLQSTWLTGSVGPITIEFKLQLSGNWGLLGPNG
ncbi:hypothetical protein SLEP1_g59203 [Rubroshorea leprosula]|nr:hypothetical protein SLEP1_g59203 [Rubroshorea leprosula]